MPDERNVDLLTGSLNFTDVALSIGSEKQGLSFSRFWPGQGEWRHTYMMSIEVGTENGTTHYYVGFGSSTADFVLSNNVMVPTRADGATLVKNAASYTFTDRNGVVYTFDDGFSAAGARATRITRPDGLTTLLRYELTGLRRLIGVENSFGYQLRIEYQANDALRIGKVTAVNMAVDNCDLYASSCAFSRTWPSLTFSGGPSCLSYSCTSYDRVDVVTDPAGRQTKYSFMIFGTGDAFNYWESIYLSSIRRPGSSQDNLSFSYDGLRGFLSSIAVLGDGTWTYSRTAPDWKIYQPGGQLYRTVTSTVLNSGYNEQYEVKDGNGNVKTLLYDSSKNLLKETRPEASYKAYSYDGRGNLLQATSVAKSGFGLSNILNSASYSASCTNRATCNKPDSVTDGRSATSNLTYDASTGNILTETLPADASGVRPVIRYAYTQRYAWIKSANGFVRGNAAVWLLSSTKTCQSSATNVSTDSCAGGSADQVTTTYDYGPDSGPNNFLLRGKVVAANGVSLRTCYGYDKLGNKISETTPRAGLSVCP